MGIMTYLLIGATAILIVPSITAKYAGRDMWLSPIFSSMSGFIVVWLAWKLNQLFPEESIIGSSEAILGRTLGKIFSFLFLFFLLHTFGTIALEHGIFIVKAFLFKTPIVVVIGSILLVCGLAVRGGIEVIARCTQIFLPMIILFSVFMASLTIPDFNLKNILPVMENGIMPAMKGSVVPHVWFVEFFFISFLFPVLNRRGKILRGGIMPVLILMVTMVASNLFCLFVLGDVTAKFPFPVYTVGRYISMAEFIQNLDGIIMAIWIGGGFIQLSVWYYTLVVGTARWLNLSDYRPLVFPIGFLTLIFSIWDIRSFQRLVSFFSTSVIPFSFTFCMLYPLLLLCVAVVRKKRRDNSAKVE